MLMEALWCFGGEVCRELKELVLGYFRETRKSAVVRAASAISVGDSVTFFDDVPGGVDGGL